MSKGKIIPWVMVIFWLVLIFILSAQPVEKSNNLSKAITNEIVEKIAPGKDVNINRMNHLLRKNAHFFAYFALAILIMIALRSVGIIGFKSILLGLLICILYAISDEVHQLFVPGRGGQVKDVIIDSMGAISGIFVFKLIKNSIKGTNFND